MCGKNKYRTCEEIIISTEILDTVTEKNKINYTILGARKDSSNDKKAGKLFLKDH